MQQAQIPERLPSENVIINAPMSFAGSAQRAWRIKRDATGWTRALFVALVIGPLVGLWWTFIAVWYVMFGLFLVPYRLLRRGSRKRKAERIRHREMMAAVKTRQTE